MAKKKKNESVEDFRKRISDKEIMDTSSPPMDLDVNAKEPDSPMTTEGKLHPPDCINFYMRIKIDLLSHIKQIARERSYN